MTAELLAGYLSDRYGGFAPPMYLLGAFNVLAALLIMGAPRLCPWICVCLCMQPCSMRSSPSLTKTPCDVQRSGLPTSRKSTWKTRAESSHVTPRQRHHTVCENVHLARSIQCTMRTFVSSDGPDQLVFCDACCHL